MSKAHQAHDFARPWAEPRVKLYRACFAASAFIAVFLIAGVGFRFLPNDPFTGTWGCFLFMTPVFIAFVASWIDVKGENRTTLEKANEFQMIWFVVAAAASEAWWEVAWLIGDVMGIMNLPHDKLSDGDRWLWIFHYYGANDTRYLDSDPGLWALEFTVVIGAFILTGAWYKLRKAGNDPAKRIPPLWWAFFTMSVMLCIFFVYFVAEFRNGFASFPRHNFWDVFMVLIYENMPWMIAPIVSLPFVARQIGYLYRQLPADEYDAEGKIVPSRTLPGQPSDHSPVGV